MKKNARLSNKELAAALGVSEQEVADEIKLLGKTRALLKPTKLFIDTEKNIKSKPLRLLLNLKIRPKYGRGFDDLAERISQMEEVESIYLMSGAFDLTVFVTDKSFHDVAMFIAKATVTA
ncbi:MAG: Lrp/AsnC family transcriptional regulator [Anaerotruncus sp.]|nr:MAG: Lrp/AsnC family transcriptional regulator [Anaerotruncus sp.]